MRTQPIIHHMPTILLRVVSLFSLSKATHMDSGSPTLSTSATEMLHRQITDILKQGAFEFNVDLEKANGDLLMPNPPCTPHPSVVGIRIRRVPSGASSDLDGEDSNDVSDAATTVIDQDDPEAGYYDHDGQVEGEDDAATDSSSDSDELPQYIPPTPEEIRAFVSRIESWRADVGRTGPTQLRRNHACLHLAKLALIRSQSDAPSTTASNALSASPQFNNI